MVNSIYMLHVMKLTFQWQHEKCSTAVFFFGPEFTSMSPCCRKNKQQKSTNSYYLFQILSFLKDLVENMYLNLMFIVSLKLTKDSRQWS